MNKKKEVLATCLVWVFIVFLTWIFMLTTNISIKSWGMKTYLSYARNLAKVYDKLDLEYFSKGWITELDTKNEYDSISVSFDLIDIRAFESRDWIDDVAKIRSATIKYLLENPNSEINNMRIWLDFYPGPGEPMAIWNFEEGKMPENSYDFVYFSWDFRQEEIDYLLLQN